MRASILRARPYVPTRQSRNQYMKALASLLRGASRRIKSSMSRLILVSLLEVLFRGSAAGQDAVMALAPRHLGTSSSDSNIERPPVSRGDSAAWRLAIGLSAVTRDVRDYGSAKPWGYSAIVAIERRLDASASV